MHVTPLFINLHWLVATNSCSRKIQGIDVSLQNHHWLCTPLPKFITYVPSRSLQKVNVALLCHPKEAQNHFHRLLN